MFIHVIFPSERWGGPDQHRELNEDRPALRHREREDERRVTHYGDAPFQSRLLLKVTNAAESAVNAVKSGLMGPAPPPKKSKDTKRKKEKK